MENTRNKFVIAAASTLALITVTAATYWIRRNNKTQQATNPTCVREQGKFEADGGGVFQSFEVESLLVDKQTKFQHIQVYKTRTFGNLMVLDGVFQNTEADEFSYHEMIAHVPMFAHVNPEKILVIGGGDGGTVRELLKHACVRVIYLVEIDPDVVEVAKQYFKETAACLDRSEVVLLHQDGANFLKDTKWNGYFDVIIVDSSDPVGPNATLFRDAFYKDVHAALKPDGIAVCQGECIWLHPKTINACMDTCKQIFPIVDFYQTSIPVYPCGIIGFMILSKQFVPRTIVRPNRAQELVAANLTKYYTPEIHVASFVKPAFFESGITILR